MGTSPRATPPGNGAWPTNWSIDPDPADRSTSRDVYGNISSYFHITQRHDALTVISRSVVEVDPPPAELYGGWLGAGAVGSSPGPSATTGRWPSEFTLDLRPPEITDAVREYAALSFTPGRPLDRGAPRPQCPDLLRLHLPVRVHDGVHAGERGFAAREGVCQDFARLAIACLRANGLAASYVSGYLATDPPPGKERMFGVDATHAWAAVWTPQNHWLGLDPTNDQLVDERYIIVGWGRDYADVPPLRGIIYTDSEKSVIDVSVDVAPFEGGVLHA